MIHREAPLAKKMNTSLSEVLSSCITTINLIKTRPLFNRLLAILWGEIGVRRSSLSFHTELSCLSRAKAIQRLFVL